MVRDWQPGTVRVPIEPSDGVLLKMMAALHANVPEADRPASRSDFSDEQWDRVKAAYRAALVQSLEDILSPPLGDVTAFVREVMQSYGNAATDGRPWNINTAMRFAEEVVTAWNNRAKLAPEADTDGIPFT